MRKFALAAALAAGIAEPGAAQADSFKSADFLTWQRDSQEFYIRTSIAMAGLIAGRNKSTQARCLEEWYFSDENAGNQQIIDTMRQYPEHHPLGIILAYFEKRCGSMVY